MNIHDPDLTTAEAAAIAEGVADDAAAAEAAAVAANPAPAVIEAAPEPEPAKPDPILAAIAESTAATRAVAESLAARHEPAPTPEVVVTPVVRNFDAEHAALAQKFDDGDLSTAEHAAELRKLTLEEADARAEAKFTEHQGRLTAQQQADADKAAADARAADDAAWNTASNAFLADPGNAALVADEIKKGAFQGALAVVARENPGISYPDMLVKAREKVTGIAAVDTAGKLREATFERRNDAGTAPTTLRDVPNAGNPGSDPGASLDNLSIEQLEDALARMSDSDRNRYLAGAPGNEQRSAA